MPIERRNLTALGRKRRREFDRSVQKLRDLGMPDWAAEYYRRASRVVGLPPHMLVCHVAVVAAGRQLQPKFADETAPNGPAVSGEPADTIPPAPSYESVHALRRQVTDLWREIQQHGAPDESGEERAATAEQEADDFEPATVTPLRTKTPRQNAAGLRSRRR
jgi:hypothetical protein